ncbi:hypothetical protein CERSUDRAFT_90947 [Gelatoporia subvermispora B]|uniref:Uncharacterized protein n=1 Tax=Ceriporiopsis subvermispora (strain B) TaxID=914234 RepID=M2RD19_CERS8|nr:hypothetical protein CERSUDRAFT_90947 [Gelatoporia subvermispora B]
MPRRGRSTRVTPIVYPQRPTDPPRPAPDFPAVLYEQPPPQAPPRDATHPKPQSAAPCPKSHPPPRAAKPRHSPAPAAPQAMPAPEPPDAPATPPIAAPTPQRSLSPIDFLLRNESSSTLASTPLGPLTPPDSTLLRAHAEPVAHWDAPPSPPPSIRDQMHVAYALEDMHTAKKLLLQLRGIDVTGDDDPRIAAVTDDDFGDAFVPPGTFEPAEVTVRRRAEAAAREAALQQRLAREERLRQLGLVWERTLQRTREDIARARWAKDEVVRMRKREELAAREREREETRAREREAERQRQVRFRAAGTHKRPVLSYGSLPTDRTPRPKASAQAQGRGEEERFRYALMPVSFGGSPPSAYSMSPPKKDAVGLSRAQAQHAERVSSSVPFVEVVRSMHGSLFPPEDSARLQPPRNKVQRELLENLLRVVEWEHNDRMFVKGKGRDDLQACAKVAAAQGKQPCVACSVSSTATASTSALSSSASTVTRTSWWSFGSRGSRSTAPTTPSSSVTSAKSPIRHSPVVSSPLIPLPFFSKPLRHSCHNSLRVAVADNDHPLALPSARTSAPAARGRPLTRKISLIPLSSIPEETDGEAAGQSLVSRVGRSVSGLMEVASQLQRAYIRATLFSIGERSRSSSESRSPPARTRTRARTPERARGKRAVMQAAPAGHRARPADVRVLLAGTQREDVVDGAEHEHNYDYDPGLPAMERTRVLLPLNAPPPAVSSPARPSLPAPPRLPFRACLPNPPGMRVRPVANPVLLRLQALQNVCAGAEVPWEGRSREGRMSAGSEMVVKVAWEGVGRSRLGWEVRVR